MTIINPFTSRTRLHFFWKVPWESRNVKTLKQIGKIGPILAYLVTSPKKDSTYIFDIYKARCLMELQKETDIYINWFGEGVLQTAETKLEIIEEKEGKKSIFNVKYHTPTPSDSSNKKKPFCIYICRSKVDNSYIGTIESTWKYYSLGIRQFSATKEGGAVSSIGLLPKKNRWVGWSHRGMSSFGVGSKVTIDSCGYQPDSKKHQLEQMIKFWIDIDSKALLYKNDSISYEDSCNFLKGYSFSVDPNSNNRIKPSDLGCLIIYYYGDLISYQFDPHPKTWGRGEWEASSLEDAKQMAIEFAESIS